MLVLGVRGIGLSDHSLPYRTRLEGIDHGGLVAIRKYLL